MDKFKLYSKWFWIGIFFATFHVFYGLIFGIALVLEKEHRKEGWIIIAWSLIAAFISAIIIGYLINKGILPQLQATYLRRFITGQIKTLPIQVVP